MELNLEYKKKKNIPKLTGFYIRFHLVKMQNNYNKYEYIHYRHQLDQLLLRTPMDSKFFQLI